jgi:hypothetical protein
MPAMPRDPDIRGKFTREIKTARRVAREYFERFPKDCYQTEVESWAADIQYYNIEFTMKRLREAKVPMRLTRLSLAHIESGLRVIIPHACMRTVLIPLLCLLVGACSSMSDVPSPEARPQPDETQLNLGITVGIADSHFAKPIEVTSLFRAPSNSLDPWMVCIRSSAPDKAGGLTYSVFYGVHPGNGIDGQYTKSRFSSFADNCATQEYHSHQ